MAVTFVIEVGSLSLTLVCGKSKNDAASCLGGRDTTRGRIGLLRGFTTLSYVAESDSPCGFSFLGATFSVSSGCATSLLPVERCTPLVEFITRALGQKS